MSHRILCSAINLLDINIESQKEDDMVRLMPSFTCTASIFKAVTPNYFSKVQIEIEGPKLLNLLVDNLGTFEFLVALDIHIMSPPSAKTISSIQKAITTTALHVNRFRMSIYGDAWLTPEISALLLDPKATPYINEFWMEDTSPIKRPGLTASLAMPTPKQFRLFRELMTSPSLLQTQTGIRRSSQILAAFEALLVRVMQMNEVYRSNNPPLIIDELEKSVPPLKEQSSDPAKLSTTRNFTNGVRNLVDYIVELVRVIENVLEPQPSVKLPLVEKHDVLGRSSRILANFHQNEHPLLRQAVPWKFMENHVLPLMERVLHFCSTDILTYPLGDKQSITFYSMNLLIICTSLFNLFRPDQMIKKRQELLWTHNSSLYRIAHHLRKLVKVFTVVNPDPRILEITSASDMSNASMTEHVILQGMLSVLVLFLCKNSFLQSAVAKNKEVATSLMFDPRDFVNCFDPRFFSNVRIFDNASNLIIVFAPMNAEKNCIKFFATESESGRFYRNACRMLIDREEISKQRLKLSQRNRMSSFDNLFSYFSEEDASGYFKIPLLFHMLPLFSVELSDPLRFVNLISAGQILQMSGEVVEPQWFQNNCKMLERCGAIEAMFATMKLLDKVRAEAVEPYCFYVLELLLYSESILQEARVHPANFSTRNLKLNVSGEKILREKVGITNAINLLQKWESVLNKFDPKLGDRNRFMRQLIFETNPEQRALHKQQQLKTQGNEFFTKQQFEKAIDFYTQAINEAPKNVAAAPIFSNRSASHLKLNKIEEAYKDGKAAIAVDSKWAKGYLRCGQATAKLGKNEEAVKSLQKFLELDPNGKTEEVMKLFEDVKAKLEQEKKQRDEETQRKVEQQRKEKEEQVAMEEKRKAEEEKQKQHVVENVENDDEEQLENSKPLLNADPDCQTGRRTLTPEQKSVADKFVESIKPSHNIKTHEDLAFEILTNCFSFKNDEAVEQWLDDKYFTRMFIKFRYSPKADGTWIVKK